MSKTFGQLGVGDEVYIINGSSVVIAEVVVVTHYAETNRTRFGTYYCKESTAMDAISCWGKGSSIIYSDIDEAIKAMKETCAKALHDYREASGALNKLETKKKTL